MAFSSSMKRAQTIKLCELCEENSPKWRCIDCNMCLCGQCKTFHLKVPATAKHQIVTIGTPIQNVQKKIIADNIPCKNHRKKMTCLFCKSCDSLICTDCVSSSHKKHNFIPIEPALDEKLDYLRGLRDKIDATIKSCKTKTSEVQDNKTRCNTIFDESLTNIKQKEQELIAVIRKHSKQLQEKVKQKRSQMTGILSKIGQDVDNAKKILEDQRYEIDATLASNQGQIIFRTNMKIKYPKFESLPNHVDQFIPETESAKKIQELFGSLQNMNILTSPRSLEAKFEVIRTFESDVPLISQVITLDNTSALISCAQEATLRKINIKDNNMAPFQEASSSVIDMTTNTNHDILLTVLLDSNVNMVKKSGEIVTFIKVAPLFPQGIHVTTDNDLIVGVKEPGNLYKLTDASQRAVRVYGMDGKQKHMYKRGKGGERLFTIPQRITTNKNKDILVIDRTSGSTGRVVVLNKDGNFRWLYEGNHQINANQQFNPRGIVTTSAGHTIVSDSGSHALHILSENGEVLTCKVVRDMGIMWPWGLDIDNDGRLWLGCGTDGEKTGAKLHIVKLI